MPRSIREILDHADALAARFEQLDPAAGVDVEVPEYCCDVPRLRERAANVRSPALS